LPVSRVRVCPPNSIDTVFVLNILFPFARSPYAMRGL
jgi:hypothetical protein